MLSMTDASPAISDQILSIFNMRTEAADSATDRASNSSSTRSFGPWLSIIRTVSPVGNKACTKAAPINPPPQ